MTVPAEPHAIRLKRLKMRCWRRGTKEMDLILGPFADARLSAFPSEFLADLEAFLEENDQDLYLWYAEKQASPDRYDNIFNELRGFHNPKP